MGKISLKSYEDLDELGQEQCSYCGGMGASVSQLTVTAADTADSLRDKEGKEDSRMLENLKNMTNTLVRDISRETGALEDKCGFDPDIERGELLDALKDEDWDELNLKLGHLEESLAASRSWEGIER